MADIGKPERKIRIDPEPLPEPEETTPAEPGRPDKRTSSP